MQHKIERTDQQQIDENQRCDKPEGRQLDALELIERTALLAGEIGNSRVHGWSPADVPIFFGSAAFRAS